VILGFKHKGLEKFFHKGIKSGIQAKHAERLRLILGRLNVSMNPRDVALPGLNLHALTGGARGPLKSVATGVLLSDSKIKM
jgi:proteic killer suppression protein